jgi:hypothetical protein
MRVVYGMLLGSGQSTKIFLLSKISEFAVVPSQPPVQWVTGILFPGVKRYHDTSL